MITNRSIRRLIEQQNERNIHISPKAVSYLKTILEDIANNIINDTLNWETNKRLTEKNFIDNMNKRQYKVGTLLYSP